MNPTKVPIGNWYADGENINERLPCEDGEEGCCCTDGWLAQTYSESASMLVAEKYNAVLARLAEAEAERDKYCKALGETVSAFGAEEGKLRERLHKRTAERDAARERVSELHERVVTRTKERDAALSDVAYWKNEAEEWSAVARESDAEARKAEGESATRAIVIKQWEAAACQAIGKILFVTDDEEMKPSNRTALRNAVAILNDATHEVNS